MFYVQKANKFQIVFTYLSSTYSSVLPRVSSHNLHGNNARNNKHFDNYNNYTHSLFIVIRTENNPSDILRAKFL